VYFVLLAPRNKRPPPITATTTTETCEEWTAAETLKALQGAKPQRQTDKPTPTNSDSEPTSESDGDDDDNNDAPLTAPNAETLAPPLTDTESDSDTSESTGTDSDAADLPRLIRHFEPHLRITYIAADESEAFTIDPQSLENADSGGKQDGFNPRPPTRPQQPAPTPFQAAPGARPNQQPIQSPSDKAKRSSNGNSLCPKATHRSSFTNTLNHTST
jgi:hypothetical protein